MSEEEEVKKKGMSRQIKNKKFRFNDPNSPSTLTVDTVDNQETYPRDMDYTIYTQYKQKQTGRLMASKLKKHTTDNCIYH